MGLPVNARCEELDTEGASPAEKLIAAEEVRDNSIKAPGKGKL